MIRSFAAWLAMAWLPGAGAARAGTAYDFTVTPLDQSTLAGAAAGRMPEGSGVGVPRTTPYFVEGGKVRVGAPTARTAYLFVDRLMYVINTPDQSVDVMKHATLTDVSAHYAAVLAQLEETAAKAPPDEREAAQRKVADLRAANERMRPPAPVYSVTTRFDSIEGHACKIWEERENGVKRLELCVAPVASVPGGVDILNGMKTLGQFRQGANFALGVEFGLGSWWPDIAGLGGIPLAVREYKYELAVAQATLTSIVAGVPAGTRLDLPEGYKIQDAPSYMQWNVR